MDLYIYWNGEKEEIIKNGSKRKKTIKFHNHTLAAVKLYASQCALLIEQNPAIIPCKYA